VILVSATILAIPVIIGGILEGPLVGLLVGLIFGVFSFLQAPTEQPPVNLWFSNPLVSIVPRLFIGVVSALVYRAARGAGEALALSLAAAAGTLTNTILVVGAIVAFGYAPLVALAPAVAPNAAAEVVIAIVVVLAVVSAWKGLELGRRRGSSV
jgi:uncharacterized membrane protein